MSHNGRGVAGKCRGLTAVHRRQEQSDVTDHGGGIQGRTQVQTLHARVIILGPIRRIVMPACQHSYMVGQASSSHSGLVGGEALSMHVMRQHSCGRLWGGALFGRGTSRNVLDSET